MKFKHAADDCILDQSFNSLTLDQNQVNQDKADKDVPKSTQSKSNYTPDEPKSTQSKSNYTPDEPKSDKDKPKSSQDEPKSAQDDSETNVPEPTPVKAKSAPVNVESNSPCSSAEELEAYSPSKLERFWFKWKEPFKSGMSAKVYIYVYYIITEFFVFRTNFFFITRHTTC